MDMIHLERAPLGRRSALELMLAASLAMLPPVHHAGFSAMKKTRSVTVSVHHFISIILLHCPHCACVAQSASCSRNSSCLEIPIKMAETTVPEVEQSPMKVAEGEEPAEKVPVPNGVHAEEEPEEQTAPEEPSEPSPADEPAAEEEASEQTAAPVESPEPDTPSEEPAPEPEAAAEEPEEGAEADITRTQPEAAAPAPPVSREDLPVWRKRYCSPPKHPGCGSHSGTKTRSGDELHLSHP